MSSLAHTFVVFAPIVGLVVDCVGGRIQLILCSSCLSILAYTLLAFTGINPIVPMLLISLCLSVTPTILMASIPLSISKHRFGIAFGIVEVVDALGGFVGNLSIGYILDTPAGYSGVMLVLLGLACLTFILAVALAIVDRRSGGHLAKATVKDKGTGSEEELEADCSTSSSDGNPPARLYV
ncbi:Major Facilitator Superfamily (MFS) [Achlya hypogyna]|uniref:Lysosomal dipeptide transporter MFSD1 n=1 Tax=Achlya hypogyna TaxID=1202772 RepID=A0A1V9YTE8_ACHHY|nr:Major Facilitator Superfamily (MFS) [Achlya hypogyna]